MTRTFLMLSACVLIVGTGIVHGLWTDRWGRSQELEMAVARLNRNMPGDLGPRKAEGAELDAGALRAAGAIGHWPRRYKHTRTGETLDVIVLCGRSGQISVHRPEHCYRSAGFEMLSAAALYRPKALAPAEFWTALFRKQEADGPIQDRIFWAWFAESTWVAPSGDPRAAFARYRALYKLYVIRAVP